MKIYGSFLRLPEVAGLSHEERRAAYRACNRKLWRDGRNVFLLAGTMVVYVLWGYLNFRATPPGASEWWMAVRVGLGCALLWIPFEEIRLHLMRPYLATFLGTPESGGDSGASR